MTKKIALKIQIFDLHTDSPTHPSHSCLLDFQRRKSPFLHSVKPSAYTIPCRLAISKHEFSSSGWNYIKQNQFREIRLFFYFPNNLLNRQKGLQAKSVTVRSISPLSQLGIYLSLPPPTLVHILYSSLAPESNYLKHHVCYGERHWRQKKKRAGGNITIIWRLQATSACCHKTFPSQKQNEISQLFLLFFNDPDLSNTASTLMAI